MLSPHPRAALETWFFKVNSGPVALLVDWITRRRDNEHWLRVSVHSPHGRAVLFEQRPVAMRGEHDFLTTERSIGGLGNVAWELEIDVGKDWSVPDIFPAGLLRMTDLALASAPLATFSGWIRHAGQQFALDGARGLVAHYWGRQLAPQWWWVSASQFDQPGVAVECAVFRSRLWGSGLELPLAYLYLRQPGRRELVMAPFGRAKVTGSAEKFEITIRRIAAPAVTLACAGRDYGDFGEGIVNTLIGDLEIREAGRLIARADGTAGLERRVAG